jgi:hypothetical protein
LQLFQAEFSLDALMLDEALFCRHLVIITIYIGSYTWLRAIRVERWDRDGHDYVILPRSTVVYYAYRPLTYIDARLTGMRFILVHTASDYHTNIQPALQPTPHGVTSHHENTLTAGHLRSHQR